MADKTETETEIEANIANLSLVAFDADAAGNFAVVPEGYSLQSLEEYQGRPNRRRGDHTFRDTRSLAAYLNIYRQPESIAYSAPSKQRITVVIDENVPDGPGGFAEHRASFAAQFTPAYQAWRGIAGKPMSQVKAGLFLEERAVDVIEPDAASIMDMVMQFDALKRVTFKQSTRLHDGQRQFTYNEENEVRGNVTLPERIKLRVPVFEGQEPDVLALRVRYRIEEGSLVFVFEIADQVDVERVAFERCEDALMTDLESSIPLLRTV